MATPACPQATASEAHRVASCQARSRHPVSRLPRPPPSSPERAPRPQRPPTASDASTNALARLATAPSITLAAGAHAPPRSATHADPDLDAWISAYATRARVSVSQRARVLSRCRVSVACRSAAPRMGPHQATPHGACGFAAFATPSRARCRCRVDVVPASTLRPAQPRHLDPLFRARSPHAPQLPDNK